jgi:hypothetical protein
MVDSLLEQEQIIDKLSNQDEAQNAIYAVRIYQMPSKKYLRCYLLIKF